MNLLKKSITDSNLSYAVMFNLIQILIRHCVDSKQI